MPDFIVLRLVPAAPLGQMHVFDDGAYIGIDPIATNTVNSRVDGLVSQLNNLQVKLNFQQAALGQVSDVAANLKLTFINALASGQGGSIGQQGRGFVPRAPVMLAFALSQSGG